MRHNFFLRFLAFLCALASSAWAASPPVINQQLLNRTVTENDPVTFFVGVTGDAPLNFSWFRNGTIISNAPNGPAYTIPFTPLSFNGSTFYVIITNTLGSTQSITASLTVNTDTTPPVITKATNAPSYIHLTAIFSERLAAGPATDPLNYFLLPPTSVVTDASLSPSGSNVLLTLDSELMAGTTYSLYVDAVTDLAASPNAVPGGYHFDFRAGTPPRIDAQPERQVVNPGDPSFFNCFASGTELFFQWYRGGTALSGETNASLSFAAVTPAEIGAYRVVITNFLGTVTSAVATLSFFDNYVVDVLPGYTFVAKHLSNSTPHFPTPSQDLTLLKWNFGNGTFDQYDFFVGIGWDPAEPVVSVGEGVVIFSPSPAPTALVFTGERVTPQLPVPLNAVPKLLGAQTPVPATYADLAGPPVEGAVMYQYKPGGNIGEFTEDNYRINYFINGKWHDDPPRLRVGEAAWVRLSTPVVITNQPLAQTNIALGQSASFTVGATGEEPLRYQWRLNGQDIPDATNATFSINAAGPTNAGVYTVTVGNLLGDIDSVPAPLHLNVVAYNFLDAFSTPAPVSDSTGLYRGNNSGATRQAGEPAHGGKRTGASVWFHWTPVVGGIVNASLAGSGFDSVLAVYTGTSVSNLYEIDSDDDADGYACARVRFNARVGVTYRFCIAGLGDEKGDVLFGWNLQPTTQVIPEFGTHPQDTTAGQGQTVELSATVTNGPVSYQWFFNGAPLTNNATATNATLTLTNVGDENVGRYFVRAQNQFRQRESRRAELQLVTPPPLFPLTGVPAVDKFFDLDVPPAGGGTPLKQPDDKFGAVQHGYTKSAASLGVTSGARDPAEPNHCGVAGGKTYWFVIRATNNGTMYINTDGSSYNTVLAAYIGPGDSYATLTNVACDNNSGLDGLDSRVSFSVKSNTLYYIAAGNVGTSSGSLNWKFQLVRPLYITNLVYENITGPTARMRIESTPGLATLVQATTNLTSPNWFTLTNYTPASGSFHFTNSLPANTNRFFRVIHNL